MTRKSSTLRQSRYVRSCLIQLEWSHGTRPHLGDRIYFKTVGIRYPLPSIASPHPALPSSPETLGALNSLWDKLLAAWFQGVTPYTLTVRLKSHVRYAKTEFPLG